MPNASDGMPFVPTGRNRTGPTMDSMDTTVPLRIVRRSPCRFEAVAATLCASSGVVADGVGPGGTLLLHVSADPAGRLSWPIPIDIDPAVSAGHEVVVEIRWTAELLSTVLPSFKGSLHARPTGQGTELVLCGRYQPATGWTEDIATRWFDHCLTRVERRIAHIVRTAAEPGGRLVCRLCAWARPPQHCHGLLRTRDGWLECAINGPDCMYRLAHPLGTGAPDLDAASDTNDHPIGETVSGL